LDLEWQSTVTLNPIKRATLNDVSMHPIDGAFPDVSRVIPSGRNSGNVAAFNPLYLADIGKAAKILGAGVNDFHLDHNGGDPAMVTFGGTGAAFAIVMPYRCHVMPIDSYTVVNILGRDAPAADEKAA
jgi:hypothetical protein